MNVTFIRIMDICYLSTLYLYFGLVASDLINELFCYFDGPLKQMSTPYLIASVTIQFWLVAISAYVIRNIISMIPNPFENMLGYARSAEVMPEVGGGVVISFILLLMQSTLKEKLFMLHDKIKIL